MLPVIALAQDNEGTIPDTEVEAVVDLEDTTAEDEPEGVGILILLLGLAGVTVVGGVMVSRDIKGDGDIPIA